MPLFPAYASSEPQEDEGDEGGATREPGDRRERVASAEARLLASDDEAAAQPPERPHLVDERDYYVDTRFDGANLPVTTLYYPGRPQYDSLCPWKTIGWKRNNKKGVTSGKWKRYYSSYSLSAGDAPEAEVSQRAEALRRALAQDPHDDRLWLRYIEFQEQWAGGEGALRAAAEAEAAAADAGGGAAARLRGPLLRLRARLLPRRDYCAMLQRALADGPPDRLELWVRLVGAAGADEAGGAGPLSARALAQLRHAPLAYPHVLFAFGRWARDAGLWELLTLLVELVAGLCFPAGGADLAAPAPEPLDARLQALEDKVVGSGLPMHAVWPRVERARAEAHWHAPPAARGLDALDPQRTPHPADVADLLLPVAEPDAALLLCAQLLRLAKVPLLPASGAVARAAAPSDEDPHGAEALLPLLTAARRLPAAHPARLGGAPLAGRLVARLLDPPHYFSAENGFLRWVGALWDACCAWAAGERRTALLCWRMRWWHALLPLADVRREEGAREARRVLAEARAALKRFAGASPLPFALCARLQWAAGGPEGARALPVAARALRAALADDRCPAPYRLYVARIVRELECSGTGAWGAWAVACAALGRPLPPDDRLGGPPPEELTLAALVECRRRCAQTERELAEGAVDAPLWASMLPGAGEWLAALVALGPSDAACPLPPAATLRELLADAGAEAQRYWEQGACAWVARAAQWQRQARAAHELAPLFPRNAFLALAAGGAAPWAWAATPARPATPEASLAPLLPALLRAEHARWAPREAGAAARACARACAGAGGALAWCARLEAEAHAARPRAQLALLGALQAQPLHKWAAVRGAALCPAEAAALPDVLLERGLRLHALPDELRPLAAGPSHI